MGVSTGFVAGKTAADAVRLMKSTHRLRRFFAWRLDRSPGLVATNTPQHQCSELDTLDTLVCIGQDKASPASAVVSLGTNRRRAATTAVAGNTISNRWDGTLGPVAAARMIRRDARSQVIVRKQGQAPKCEASDGSFRLNRSGPFNRVTHWQWTIRSLAA